MQNDIAVELSVNIEIKDEQAIQDTQTVLTSLGYAAEKRLKKHLLKQFHL